MNRSGKNDEILHKFEVIKDIFFAINSLESCYFFVLLLFFFFFAVGICLLKI